MRPSRKLLRVLCALTFLGGGVLLGLGVHVAMAAQLPSSAAALATLGALALVFSIIGFVGAGREKSALLMLYFFLNFFLLTALFLASYAAVAFHESLGTWLRVHWSHPVLAALRQRPCCSTYDRAITYLEHEFYWLGGIGFACVGLVLVAMYCVVRIVTIPIVMKHLLTVLNFIFILLGIGIFAYGCSVKTRDELTSGQEWIAIVYIVVGTILFALAVIGIIGSRSKSRTLLLIYIVGIAGCLVSLLVCAGAAFSFSDKLANDYTKTTIACDIDLPGCTNCTTTGAEAVPCLGVVELPSGHWASCNATTVHCKHGFTLLQTTKNQGYTPNDIGKCGQCPEWSHDDIHAYLESGLQLLGLFAAVVCFFIVVGFVSALILRKSLAGYQTDSI